MKELWFKIDGKLLRLSKLEFWTLIELKCTSNYEDPTAIEISKLNCLVEKYFSKDGSIHRLDALVDMVNNPIFEFPNAKSFECILATFNELGSGEDNARDRKDLSSDKCGKNDKENKKKHKKMKDKKKRKFQNSEEDDGGGSGGGGSTSKTNIDYDLMLYIL